MSKMDLVEIFKKRTRSPFRPRASDIVDKLFPDFKRIEVPGSPWWREPVNSWASTSM